MVMLEGPQPRMMPYWANLLLALVGLVLIFWPQLVKLYRWVVLKSVPTSRPRRAAFDWEKSHGRPSGDRKDNNL